MCCKELKILRRKSFPKRKMLHNIKVHIFQGGPDYVLSSQTEKLMAGTKFSDYLGLNPGKKAKN